MRDFGIGILALAIALAGCGSKADKGGSDGSSAGGAVGKDAVSKAIAEIERPEPGKYRMTVSNIELDFPGAPREMAEMMRATMGKGATTEHCLTPEQADKGFRELAKQGRDDDCTYKRFDVSGGKIDADMTCKEADGSIIHATLTGEGGRTSSTMTMAIDMNKPPLGKGTMRMTMHQDRIGECD